MQRIENLPRRIKTRTDGAVYEFRIYRRSSGKLGIAYFKLGNPRERIISTAVNPNYPVQETMDLFGISVVSSLEDAIEETYSRIDYLASKGFIECLPI